MATEKEIQDAVRRCLRRVPFEHAAELDAPFDDFWKEVDEQDERTNREIHRVDLFIKCLRDALRSGVLINRDMLLEGKIGTPQDLVDLILD
jgi:hypothetical protein